MTDFSIKHERHDQVETGRAFVEHFRQYQDYQVLNQSFKVVRDQSRDHLSTFKYSRDYVEY